MMKMHYLSIICSLVVFATNFFQLSIFAQPGPGICHVIVVNTKGDTIPFHNNPNRIYAKGGYHKLRKKMMDVKVYGSNQLIYNASGISRYFDEIVIVIGLKKMKIDLVNQPNHENDLNLKIQFQPGHYQFDLENWLLENKPDYTGYIQVKLENLLEN